MRGHWLDRLARTTVGKPRSPAPAALSADDEPTFTRRTGLKTAVAFVAAVSLGGLRAMPARADEACMAKCQKIADLTYGAATRGCLNYAASPTSVIWFSSVIPGLIVCATVNGAGWAVIQAACATEAYQTDDAGNCAFNGPKPPPPPPRPPIKDFKDLEHPAKPPPPKPGQCGKGPLPPGAACCASKHGPIPCATGCASNGDGCCPSASNQC